jgi:glycosyltransferase involved in cell wall biosynthesis
MSVSWILWKAVRKFRSRWRSGTVYPKSKPISGDAPWRPGASEKIGTAQATVTSMKENSFLPHSYGAISYWAKLLVEDGDQLRWFVATATKVKSMGARDILSFAATHGFCQTYSSFQLLLERVQKSDFAPDIVSELEPKLWLPAVRDLARLLYCQRVWSMDLQMSLSLYNLMISSWGALSLDDIDRSYVSDLLIDVGQFRRSHELISTVNSKNEARRLSQYLVDVNTCNPYLLGDMSEAERWLAQINRIYIDKNLAPIELSEGDSLPFFRLKSEAPRMSGDIPLISVIMPIYQPDISTDVAISSLLNQSWWNIEIIAVDDGSPVFDREGRPTDFRTRLDAWSKHDSRVRVIFNQENRGAYWARNTGYEQAKGKYVTVADKDDWHHPQKLERQASDLERHPDKVANMVNWARVDPKLRFRIRWGPDFVVSPDFSSLMLRREEVFPKFGYWDDVRKAADGEFKFRLQAYYGINIQPEEMTPMAFSLLGDGNLTSKDLGYGFEDDDRRAYRHAYRSWHKAIRYKGASPYLPRSADDARRFPAPNRFLPDSPRHEEFDVIYLSEFGFEGGNSTILRNEISVSLSAGLRVGIIPCYNFLIRSASLQHMSSGIQELIQEGKITRVPLSAEVRTKLLIIRWPTIMQVTHGTPGKVEADAIVVIADHPPYEEENGRISYDVATVSSNVATMFGREPLWASESEDILGVLKKHVPPNALDHRIWNRTFPDPLPKLRVPKFEAIPTIGRHGRDDVSEWPGSKKEFLAAYPVDGSVKVSILGGVSIPIKQGFVSGEALEAWTVYPFNCISVSEYLRDLDFFVYFPSNEATKAYPMTVMEALSFGCVCLLPHYLKRVFGEAAIYLRSDEVPTMIRELWGNRQKYESQQQKGREFFNENASSVRYLERLATLERHPI